MSLNINEAGSAKDFGPRPLPRVGTQAARIWAVADIGVQERLPFQGQEKKPDRMLWVGVELPKDTFDLNGKQVPHRISPRVFTFSNDPKAALFKFLKSVDPQDEFKGDLEKLLGLGILATVVHAKVTGADGVTNTYANFAGASLPPEGFPIPELSEPPVLFTMKDATEDSYKRLPPFIREKIQKAINYKGSKVEEIVKGLSNETATEAAY